MRFTKISLNILVFLLAACVITICFAPPWSSIRHGSSLTGLASTRDPKNQCINNPFLASWNAAAFTSASESLILARGKLAESLQYTIRFSSGWERFNSAPSVQLCRGALHRFPETASGIKSKDDGGKILCSIQKLQAPCVIYSLGSNLQFEFEFEMAKHTPCDIFTFDCTVDVAQLPQLPPQVHFHSVCLGEEGTTAKNFRSLSSLAAEFGHKEIALLKMDIEGHEFSVIESLYRGALSSTHLAKLLPFQISFELHYVGSYDVWEKGLTVGEISLLWVQLADLGYVVVSREDNRLCDHCSEYTVVKAFC
jgi:hypothetical protein